MGIITERYANYTFFKEKIVRQKFIISKEGQANDLTIREYAVIGKIPNNHSNSIPLKDEYTFLYKEMYKGEEIEPSLLKGTNNLISMLRTDSLFPAGPLAAKIAVSVEALFRSPEDGTSELFFDDKEQFDGHEQAPQD